MKALNTTVVKTINYYNSINNKNKKLCLTSYNYYTSYTFFIEYQNTLNFICNYNMNAYIFLRKTTMHYIIEPYVLKIIAQFKKKQLFIEYF